MAKAGNAKAKKKWDFEARESVKNYRNEAIPVHNFEMELPSNELKDGQYNRPEDRPSNEPNHHKIEAKSWGALALWIFGDLLILVGHEHIGGWVLAITIWVVGGFFTYHACNAWMPLRKTLVIVYAVVCVIAPIGIIALWSPKNSPKSTAPEFALIAREYIENRKNAPFMLLWNNINDGRWIFPFGRVMSPIPIEMFAQLTSLRSENVSVNSYSFEGKKTNGEWVAMTPVDHHIGRIVLNKNLDHPHEFIYSKYFDDSMSQNQPIRKGDVVEGVIFLEAPSGFSGDIRIRIRDSSDAEYIQLLNKTGSTNYLDESIGRNNVTVNPIGTNVAHFPVTNFSDAMGLGH
jgi:hypothetical protein